MSDTMRIIKRKHVDTTSAEKEVETPPKLKEAFVNEQVTKFFEIPIKEPKITLHDDSKQVGSTEATDSTCPLFQKSNKIPSKQHLSSKASLERSTTSPAITVTSWEETNKGLDELTHGSHIQHPNFINKPVTINTKTC